VDCGDLLASSLFFYTSYISVFDTLKGSDPRAGIEPACLGRERCGLTSWPKWTVTRTSHPKCPILWATGVWQIGVGDLTPPHIGKTGKNWGQTGLSPVFSKWGQSRLSPVSPPSRKCVGRSSGRLNSERYEQREDDRSDSDHTPMRSKSKHSATCMGSKSTANHLAGFSYTYVY